MQCNYPQGTYRKDGTPTYRPCGSCIGCRLEYSRQWAIRCVHEAAMHEQNSFLTLTYNNENLPDDKSVSKAELQKFIKRLRKKIEPKKIRYFGCGEYGDRLSRPHYHLCVFGHQFNDLEIRRKGNNRLFKNRIKKGNINDLFISKELEKIWKKGFCTVGEVTFESAGYVARYVAKKITGDMAKKHYGDKSAEFALMSRRPGIGTSWIKQYMSDVYPKDYHTLNGVKVRPTRFYDAVYAREKPEQFKKLKERRIEKEKRCKYESHLRLYQKELHTKNVTKSLERKIH